MRTFYCMQAVSKAKASLWRGCGRGFCLMRGKCAGEWRDGEMRQTGETNFGRYAVTTIKKLVKGICL